MYQYSDEIVEAALVHYTIQNCEEFDELFYFQASADCIARPALEACIVIDYLDKRFSSLVDQSVEKIDTYLNRSE